MNRFLFLCCVTVMFGVVDRSQSQPVQTQQQTPANPSIGGKAPIVQARDAQGKLRRLSDLRGRRWLVLTFFPRCFTGTCSLQLTSLRDFYPALQKAGAEVWAVSTDGADGPRGQRAFARHLKLPFALLPDTDRKICLAFGAVQTRGQMAARLTVLIDPQGIVRSIDKQISPRTHGSDVLALVTKLRAKPHLFNLESP